MKQTEFEARLEKDFNGTYRMAVKIHTFLGPRWRWVTWEDWPFTRDKELAACYWVNSNHRYISDRTLASEDAVWDRLVHLVIFNLQRYYADKTPTIVRTGTINVL